MGICFCPWLSNDTSTNRFGLSYLNQGIQLSELWTDQEDVSPWVPLTIMTVPKVVIICLYLIWVVDHWDHLTMTDTLWTSGALVPPGKNTDAGTPCSMTRISMLSDKWRLGVQSSHTGNTPTLSVCLFNIRGSRAWAIVLSTFFTWGKWTLTKHNERLNWGIR